MVKDIIAFIVLILGALITYRGKYIYEKIKRCEISDKNYIIIKLIGFAVTIVGVLILFLG